MQFTGFPRGVRCTPVPDPVLGSLLEQIQDLAELKVTLRGLWLLNQKRGALRYVTLEEFLNDRALLQGLKTQQGDSRGAIKRGLELAVGRKTFLTFQTNAAGAEQRVYLLNTENGRRALAQMRRGNGVLPQSGAYEEGFGEPSAQSRPNIFALFEDNVGTISPLLAEELKEAEQRYPASWIYDAFKIAVDENKRSWRYVAGILRRWAAEGRDHGEPGRHSKEDNSTRYLEEYQRRRGHLPWESANR